jgi:L-aminopeptidase/D-esterase-like protein
MGFTMEGVLLGNAQDLEGGTGCTVVLLPPGSVGGGEVRGLAPGTRETALLGPLFTVAEVNAFLLTGGSAFGLAAADGVMRFLEERGVGYPTPAGPVPIVPAAVIYDLAVGSPAARPDAAMGYRACREAGPELDLVGAVGAGTGATVGKVLGMQWCSRGGLGTAFMELPGGVRVYALAVVNAFGDVVDEGGRVIAGARHRPPAPTPPWGSSSPKPGLKRRRSISWPGRDTTA